MPENFYVRWPSSGSGGGGSGTVTSVALADGSTTPIYVISGSPVTSAGTLTFTLGTQSANTVFAGPTTGSAAQPTFRSLVSADLPTGNLTESTSAVLTITAGTGAVIGSGTTIQVKQAGTSQSGYLSSTDWNTFNNKQATITEGNLTEATSSVLTISGGTNAVIGSGTSIQVKQASTSVSGYLSSTDWNTFNGKQTSTLSSGDIFVGNGSNVAAAVALSGDATLANTGAITLATVNTNTGSFGSSTSIPNFTVNGKGLLTAAGSNVVVAPAGTLSGTTLNSTVVTSSLTAVGTIATGTWQGTLVGVAFGGTGLATLTTGNVILGAGTSTPAFVAPGTSGNVLTSNGSTWTSAAAPSGPTTSYWSGYMPNGTNWSTSSSTLADPTNSGNNTLTKRQGNITVTAAASNLPGITFTPASAAAVYQITATFCGGATVTAGADTTYSLTDGTTVIVQRDNQTVLTQFCPIPLNGIYVPGTGSAITVKIQIATTSSGVGYLGAVGSIAPSIEWTILRIA
jgi:hypothetical protein